MITDNQLDELFTKVDAAKEQKKRERELLDIALPILEGLLASGHYSAAGVLPHEDTISAVDFAIRLANELRLKIEIDVDIRREIEIERQIEADATGAVGVFNAPTKGGPE